VEDRLGEGVEVGEDLAALGAEVVGVVEDRGNAALLEQWRKWYRKSAKSRKRDRLSTVNRTLAKVGVVGEGTGAFEEADEVLRVDSRIVGLENCVHRANESPFWRNTDRALIEVDRGVCKLSALYYLVAGHVAAKDLLLEVLKARNEARMLGD
jgi:hypothetical protein